MEKFGIPELSGEQTLPEQGQTYSQSQAGEEAAQALIQLLLDQGEITPEEAAELTNQGKRRIQIPDWDYGEPEELVSGYPLGWKKPGAFPEEKRGVSRLRGSSRRPQSGRLLPGIESFLPEEFQRPQGLSDWDWSLRQGEAAEAKSDLERSAALYNVGRTKLNAAKRISEELGRKVVFDGTMSVDKTGAIDPETGTIRLNARVGGPENLFDNAVRLLEEQPAEFPLDSADAGGYNAGEERLLLEAAGVGRVEIIAVDDLTDNLLQTKPKNSPNPQKWRNKGGKISIDKDGVWVYTNSKGQSVKYVDGYPDFKGAGLTNQEVDIGQFKDYTTDFKNADLLAPNGPRDAVNNTWHHSQDGHTLQEVDKAVHKEFTHRGGMSLNNIKRGELK